jgi:hypothetical protein
MAAKSFEDLLVWRKAHEFVVGVYRYTATFPAAETYGLRSQFRRRGGFHSSEHRRRIPAPRTGR